MLLRDQNGTKVAMTTYSVLTQSNTHTIINYIFQEHCISDYIKLIVQSYVVHANILN
jgi:hypothetical protein